MKQILCLCTRDSCRNQKAEGWDEHVPGGQLFFWLRPITAEDRGFDDPTQMAWVDGIPDTKLRQFRRARDEISARVKAISGEVLHAG